VLRARIGRLRASALIVLAAACVAATGSAAAAPAPAPAPCADADHIPTAATAARARTAIGCLLDAARAARGLPALRPDPRLRSTAERFARALDPDRPLTHTGADGSSALDRIAGAGYGRGAEVRAAETLGRGHGGVAAPATRVATWLRDAPTRRLLLSATYRDVGVGGVVRGAVTTYVIELARRTPVSSSGSATSRSSR
jgi:uncharacterized protein YkwD